MTQNLSWGVPFPSHVPICAEQAANSSKSLLPLPLPLSPLQSQHHPLSNCIIKCPEYEMPSCLTLHIPHIPGFPLLEFLFVALMPVQNTLKVMLVVIHF